MGNYTSCMKANTLQVLDMCLYIFTSASLEVYFLKCLVYLILQVLILIVEEGVENLSVIYIFDGHLTPRL